MGRRISFWFAVAGVSVLANFALEAVTNTGASAGLARFTAFTHRGNS